ncbi:hypothetical protein [Rhizobium sp. RAF56]|uniref:hypothetical protein n=1 Tax=Rhizobium sp. RAF56 TaxID=3233062 RepID=UPI003F9486E2
MKVFSTELIIAATVYVNAHNHHEAKTRFENVLTGDVGVNQRSRFVDWIDDHFAYADVHFSSSMTFLDGADLCEVSSSTWTLPWDLPVSPPHKNDKLGEWIPKGKFFAADLILTAPALVRSKDRAKAEEHLARLRHTVISADDKRWLRPRAATCESSLSVSPTLTVGVFSQIRELSKFDDDAANLAVDAVVRDVLEIAKNDRQLMEVLEAQAKHFRVQFRDHGCNVGFMTDQLAIEALLRTRAWEAYKSSQGFRPYA